MKFCTNCGTQLNDNDNFCTECGYKSPQFQPQAEITNSTDNANNYNEFESPISQSATTTNSVYDNTKPRLLNRKRIIIIIAIVLLVSIVTVVCLKQIPYKSFDIKDDELIETLDELGVDVSFSPLKHNELEELDGFDEIDTDAIIYRITVLEETGILVLSHSFSSHIRCIMVCFDDNTTAAAVISALASELDYSFSTSKAMNSVLLDGKTYTSDRYTVMKKDLSSELSGIFLTPKEHLEFSVKSVLPN